MNEREREGELFSLLANMYVDFSLLMLAHVFLDMLLLCTTAAYELDGARNILFSVPYILLFHTQGD
jgi:hypothetical protein